jgi:hypothetical protein
MDDDLRPADWTRNLVALELVGGTRGSIGSGHELRLGLVESLFLGLLCIVVRIL